ncbi:TetR/AcrR family transcriptional regulator [Nocardiopsis composta]|uniref:DNA-binding transcriptional regulator YbjK n=1 Tax=Nocardiopsis composta TaxID=157465 RepID=A0A7W8QS66_9ACTN|nr:TetR family transcriptional regulator [Nocardiopsis composta]MBB5435635.1 DNA-binding transcriptional regulator YbjK [Nocardiopsis composta]
MGEAVDGRRARGERRRAELVAATLRVVARDGAAKVTHRAVAKEACAPPSSAVYYFATLDDLLVAALTEATEDYVRRLREALHGGAEPVAALGGVLADGCRPGGGRERVLAEFELSLLAARRPSLRPVVRRWNDLVADVARRYTADPVAVRAAVAAANGLSMEAVLAEEGVSEKEMTAVLRHVLGTGAPAAEAPDAD